MEQMIWTGKQQMGSAACCAPLLRKGSQGKTHRGQRCRTSVKACGTRAGGGVVINVVGWTTHSFPLGAIKRLNVDPGPPNFENRLTLFALNRCPHIQHHPDGRRSPRNSAIAVLCARNSRLNNRGPISRSRKAALPAVCAVWVFLRVVPRGTYLGDRHKVAL